MRFSLPLSGQNHFRRSQRVCQRQIIAAKAEGRAQDLSKVKDWDPAILAELIGNPGLISLEVHLA
jgi:hypothetical protein